MSHDHLDRRSVIAAALAAACSPRTPRVREAEPPAEVDLFARVEADLGGRLGVFALDTGSGRQLARRADERFAMCSTFKWALAAAVLARVDEGELALGRQIPFGEADLLEYAPVTRAAVARGQMSVEELAAATVTLSDNTAANLLLPLVGGPQGLTAFFRQLGDRVTRLDRNEPTLNTNLPRDARDTTSPRAMVSSLRAVISGAGLKPANRERLLGWLLSSTTGRNRLRAGLPPSWITADKTGTCSRGAANDVAVVWPPGRPPILIAAYSSDSTRALAQLDAAHAEIGRLIAVAFG